MLRGCNLARSPLYGEFRVSFIAQRNSTLVLNEEDVEDIQAKLIREKASRRQYVKKTNKTLGRPYIYAWRYPSLRFTKYLHLELQFLAENDRYDELCSRFAKLQSVGKHPSPKTVEILVEAHSKNKNLPAAHEAMATLANDMHRITRNSFQHVAAGYLQEDNLTKAEETLRSLTKEYKDREVAKYSPRLHGSFVAFYWRKEQKDAASAQIELFKEEKYKRLQDYQSFVGEFSLGQVKENESFFLELISAAFGDLAAYDLLAYQYANFGDVAEVQRVLDLVSSKDIELDGEMYDSLILALTKNEKVEETLEVLQRCRKDNISLCRESYDDSLRLCIDNNKGEIINQLIVEMELAGMEPDSPLTLVALMNYYADKGDSKQAKHYWQKAKKKGALVNPEESHKVISLVAKESHAYALDMFNFLNTNFVLPTKETFNELIESHKAAGLDKQAKHLEQFRFRSHK